MSECASGYSALNELIPSLAAALSGYLCILFLL